MKINMLLLKQKVKAQRSLGLGASVSVILAVGVFITLSGKQEEVDIYVNQKRLRWNKII